MLIVHAGNLRRNSHLYDGKKIIFFFIFFCRAHLNDLENILPFLIVGSFYVLTNPSLTIAKCLFQVATIARIIHTVVYAIIVIPQPSRLLSWLVHYLITLYMAVMVLIYSYSK